MRLHFISVLLIVALLPCASQNRAFARGGLPPCGERATSLSEPWIQIGLACLEQVINDPSAGTLAFTALAVAPAGTLYAARPLAGEVYALTDSDGDFLPDKAQLIADGLTLPNGLTVDGGALYIAGGSHVYRWQDGALTTLVSDLPSGGGFWTGGIAIDDGRLYVTTGAPCDFCAADDSARGAVLSYALDGSDRQVVATGLRQPVNLALMDGELWVTDSAREGLFDTPDLDELDRVEVGANFGFPYCVGVANTPDMAGFDCANAAAPAVALPTASTPTGLAVYRGGAIPLLEGKLIVALNGSYNQLDLRGFAIVTVDPLTGTVAPLIPARPENTPNTDFSVQEMNYRGSGFYPQRPLDVAVSDEGWLYVSITDGRILALRP